jgi:hypothetical protein
MLFYEKITIMNKNVAFDGHYILIMNGPLAGDTIPESFAGQTSIETNGTVEHLMGGFEFKTTEPTATFRLPHSMILQIETPDAESTIFWPKELSSLPEVKLLEEEKPQAQEIIVQKVKKIYKKRIPKTSQVKELETPVSVVVSSTDATKNLPVVEPDAVSSSYQGVYAVKFKKLPFNLPELLKVKLKYGKIEDLFGRVEVRTNKIVFTSLETIDPISVDKTEVETVWGDSNKTIWENPQPLRKPFYWS